MVGGKGYLERLQGWGPGPGGEMDLMLETGNLCYMAERRTHGVDAGRYE